MDFKTARSNMVENQIRANKVTNLSVINAFKDVPREKFVPDARIGLIQGKITDFDNKDVVIGMLQSICRDKYPKDIFKRFGMVAVDEAHHISSRVFSNALPIVSTKYMMGLSATPNRKDGLTKVFKWFLGDIAFKASSMTDFKVLTYQIKRLLGLVV